MRRVEDHDVYPRHVAEAFQRRFAGISGGRSQDQHLPLILLLLLGIHQKVRKEREGKIFECTGPSMEHLCHGEGLRHRLHRHDLRCLECPGVCIMRQFLHILFRDIGEEMGQHISRQLFVG